MSLNWRFASMSVIAVMVFASSLDAQIGIKMQAKVDPATEQLAYDLLNRRVSIAPTSILISRDAKSAVFEFSNPTKDTLNMEISISNSTPNMTKRIFPKGSAPKKTMIEENSPDSMSIYKPLSPWLSLPVTSLVLAPGEKRKIDILVSIPDSLIAGEYMAWVIAEVAPRKVVNKNPDDSTQRSLAKKNDGVLVTVSSGKLTYTVPALSNSEADGK